MRQVLATTLMAVMMLGPLVNANAAPAKPASKTVAVHAPAATPITHIVVIFGENISFDHYFGTYPNATNPSGEPPFTHPGNAQP
jgi:phospholipase C